MPPTRVWASLAHLKPYVKAVYLAVSNFDIQKGVLIFYLKWLLQFLEGEGLALYDQGQLYQPGSFTLFKIAQNQHSPITR